MSRRHRAEKRQVLPDAKFGEIILTKFMNVLMYDGKKSVAEGILYAVLEKLAANSKGVSAVEIFKQAIENVRPHLEVRSRRVGGATYQVPVEVRKERGEALSMRWLIESSRKRGEHTMAERLHGEIQAAANNNGAAVKKKEDTHRMAEANKAFSHFRW
jgi:small subunit ribosomal protein S7